MKAFQQRSDQEIASDHPIYENLVSGVGNSNDYNFGRLIAWNEGSGTMTFELYSGFFSHLNSDNVAMTISLVHESAGGHFLPSSVGGNPAVTDKIETSIMGIPTTFLNSTWEVVSYDSDSFVLETKSDGIFYPTVAEFYSDSNLSIVNSDIRADLFYYNSSEYLPAETTSKWELKQSGQVVSELSPNSNTYLQSSKEINEPSLEWTISSYNDRVSPVVYTDSSDLLIISNLIDSKTSVFEDIDINWVKIKTTQPGISNGVIGEFDNDGGSSLVLKRISGIKKGDYLVLKTIGGADALVKVIDEYENSDYTLPDMANGFGHSVSGSDGTEFNTWNSLYKLVGYVDETHATEGTAISKYITNKITFTKNRWRHAWKVNLSFALSMGASVIFTAICYWFFFILLSKIGVFSF